MSSILLVALPLQAGLIAAGEAQRPMERYAFYAVPLLFAAFFLYLERGAPRRRAYAATALGLGGLALAVPFSTSRWSRSPSTHRRSLRSPPPVASCRPATRRRCSAPLVCSPPSPRPPSRCAATAEPSPSLRSPSFAIGVAAYSGDRRMTRRAVSPAQNDWLDRMGIEADVLVLRAARCTPAGRSSPGTGTWAGRTTSARSKIPAARRSASARTGRSADGMPVTSRHLVVNEAGGGSSSRASG